MFKIESIVVTYWKLNDDWQSISDTDRHTVTGTKETTQSGIIFVTLIHFHSVPGKSQDKKRQNDDNFNFNKMKNQRWHRYDLFW